MVAWHGHALLGRKAAEVLPDWEKQLLKPDLSSEALAFPHCPSPIRNGAEKLGAFCHILDWVYEKEFRPYCFLKDGRMIPHEPVNALLEPDKRNPSYDGNCKLIKLLIEDLIEAIRKEDWEEVIRKGGVVAHFLQEPFTPGHSADSKIFFEIFADPDPERHLNMHRIFDNATDQFEALQPCLMGRDSSEAAFHLTHHIFKGIREAKKYIQPAIESAYKGEPLEKQAAILANQSKLASWVTASAWHTAFCIAYQRFAPTEIAALSADLPLTDLLPSFWHPSPYNEMLPGCFVQNSRKIPMEVYEQAENQTLQRKTVKNGFGLYGYAAAKFYVDGHLYPEFTCRIGLAANLPDGQFPNRKTIFTVEIDEQENLVYSNDMEYGTQVVAQAILLPGKPLQTIHANIKGAKTLVLCALTELYDQSGKILYEMPHVAVCEPVLRGKG